MSEDRAGRAAAMAFVTALVTLLTQVLVHRIVSAKLLTNYAFLVISLTMLGFAFSGVILSRWLDHFHREEGRWIQLAAACFAGTLIAATWAFYLTPVWPQVATSRPDFVRGFFRTIPLALLYAVPFTFCGFILGLLLSVPGRAVQRVYFFDLLGSAVGAALAIPAITWLGAERGVLAGALLLVAAAALLWRPQGAARGALAVAAGAAALAFWMPGRVFEMRYPPHSVLEEAVSGRAGYALEHVAWDAVARIEVSRFPPAEPPSVPSTRCLIGEDPRFTRQFQKVVTQNNWAGTMALAWDGRRESLEGIGSTIYGAAYRTSEVAGPRVAIIGVGAGMDVLNALYYGATHVDGVEVNAATVDAVTRVFPDYFGRWSRDPRLNLVVDDGRSFLASGSGTYDVIQISGVDSFAGTAASPHIFSENYLYTAEAYDLYLSRLSPGGILNVMRPDHRVPQAMLRALVTAVGALRRAGISQPAQHVVTITTDDSGYTAMLVKRTPFTPRELANLWQWVGSSRTFGVSAAPGLVPQEPNVLSEFLALADPREEARYVARYPFDVSPPTDDRPFYFRFSHWAHAFPADPQIWAFVPVMEYSLILLVGLIGTATFVLVYLPLRWLRGDEDRRPSFGKGVYFAALGLGFMAVEIALLQKCGWFLGHPNYAVAVVLATLLVASGLGATLSPMLARALGGIRFVGYLLAAVLLAYYFAAFPLLRRLEGASFPLKVLLVVAVVAPSGLLMGTFLPWGLARLQAASAHLIAWAWGINGIFSVLGPILGIGVAMSWGGNALLLSAVPLYLAAGFASVALERKPA
jgi:MFS family permease